MVSGSIESCSLPGQTNAYCKYQLAHGEDWQLLSGMEDGITQTAIINTSAGGEASIRSSRNPRLVWNFPLDITYRSTNPFGWPQLIVSVYGIDFLGRDVIQGYGCIHLPTTPGSHTLKVRLFRPVSSSGIQRWLSWILGSRPEFSDPRFPALSEGREVTRVQSYGDVLVKINLTTKGMDAFGYDHGAS